MLKRWPLLLRENGFVTKAACLMEGGMVMLERWAV